MWSGQPIYAFVEYTFVKYSDVNDAFGKYALEKKDFQKTLSENTLSFFEQVFNCVVSV